MSGPFLESGAREITLHERAETFAVVARFLNCQPIVLSDAPRDLPLVADRWGLTELFEAVFKHAEERVHSHGDIPPIPAWRLVEQFVPIMSVVDVPDRFKKYIAMRLALEMKDINEAFKEKLAKVELLEDECCTGCGEGVACRRRKVEKKDGEPGGEVRNASVKSLTYAPSAPEGDPEPVVEGDQDVAAPAAEGETAPAVTCHVGSAAATDADDVEAGAAGGGPQLIHDEANADIDETPPGIVEAQPATAETQSGSEPPAAAESEPTSDDPPHTATEGAAAAASSQLPVTPVASEVNGSLPQPTPEAEANGPGEATDAEGDAVMAPSGEGVVAEGGTTNDEAEEGSTEEPNENLILAGSVEGVEDDIDADAGEAASVGFAASVGGDDELIDEGVDTPPTVEELRQPWHDQFDIWKIFEQRKMMKYVVHYMSHYGNVDYTLFVLDIVLRELEPILNDEEAIKLLREIDWDWEGPSHEALQCPASEKWSARAWRLIAFAQSGFEGTGSDIRLSWKYNGLVHDITERAKQLLNKNDSEANSTDSSDVESESGFSVKWDRRSGSNDLEFSLALNCSDLDQQSPEPLYLSIRLLEREEMPLDMKNSKRDVALRIKVIESGCGCAIRDDDGFQGFTVSPTRTSSKSSVLSSFKKHGDKYQIFGSEELVSWMLRHTPQCGLLFHVRLYVFPLADDEEEEDEDEQNQYAEECTCGFCECDEC